ncbi:MAG: YciI family protein [Alphaproteobacteria bacterium]
MSLFAVLLEDDPSRADVRSRLMPDHLAFLEAHPAIRSAGPLRDPMNDAPAGGLWLVEAVDAALVDALVRADPFFPAGLRRAVRILEWRQVFADGARRA